MDIRINSIFKGKMWLIFFFALISSCLANNSPSVESLNRKIDLEGNTVKINYELFLKDHGNEFVLLLDKVHDDRLAFIQAKVGSDSLRTSPLTRMPSGYMGVKIDLGNFAVGAVKLDIETVMHDLQSPKPAEIIQGQSFYAKFSGNSVVTSPYLVKQQKTQVVLPQNNVMMYTSPLKPAARSGKIITYGPYSDQPPYSEFVFSCQYPLSRALTSITSIERLIEVSHWGNIAVEEHIHLVNAGARLVGEFSRLDYRRAGRLTSVLANWRSLLPSTARDIYYRDSIGNVSTSTVSKRPSATLLDITPRFPLMGGWRTQYIVGYNVPAHQYLYRKGNRFALKMRLIDHVHDDQLVKHLRLRIVLPEGIENVQLQTPYTVKRLPDTTMPTYLDTTGRLVINVEKDWLVERHIDDFVVTYDFQPFLMIREPCMIVCALLLLFASIIVFVRLDFSLAKSKLKEVSLKTEAFVAKVAALHDRRRRLYEKNDDNLEEYRLKKDADAFRQQCARVETELAGISAEMRAVQEQMRGMWAHGAQRLAELQEKDRRYCDIWQTRKKHLERHLDGGIQRADYRNLADDLVAQGVELSESMNQLVSML